MSGWRRRDGPSPSSDCCDDGDGYLVGVFGWLSWLVMIHTRPQIPKWKYRLLLGLLITLLLSLILLLVVAMIYGFGLINPRVRVANLNILEVKAEPNGDLNVKSRCQLIVNNPNIFPVNLGSAEIKIFTDQNQTSLLGSGTSPALSIGARHVLMTSMDLPVDIYAINRRKGGKAEGGRRRRRRRRAGLGGVDLVIHPHNHWPLIGVSAKDRVMHARPTQTRGPPRPPRPSSSSLLLLPLPPCPIYPPSSPLLCWAGQAPRSSAPISTTTPH